MDRRLLIKVTDVHGTLVITKLVEPDQVDDFIMKIPNIYDAGDIEINNVWYYVDEMKDLVRTKSFTKEK